MHAVTCNVQCGLSMRTGGAWWSPRLLAAPLQPAVGKKHTQTNPLGRSMLITGGLGGLGILFAHWAAQQASRDWLTSYIQPTASQTSYTQTKTVVLVSPAVPVMLH